MNRVSSRDSRLIHNKRVPKIVTSHCHLTLSHFFIFFSEWATLEAHNFKNITGFKKILKPSNSVHQKLYFKTEIMIASF